MTVSPFILKTCDIENDDSYEEGRGGGGGGGRRGSAERHTCVQMQITQVSALEASMRGNRANPTRMLMFLWHELSPTMKPVAAAQMQELGRSDSEILNLFEHCSIW